MFLLDVGGGKNKRTLGGKWKIMDKKGNKDYVCNLNNIPVYIPTGDNTVDAIFCSHTLEHIEPKAIPHALRDMRRILKPECPIRICVPDFSLAIKWYLTDFNRLKSNTNPTINPDIPKTRMGYLTSWIYTPGGGHRIGFDYELIYVYLDMVGFRNIRRMSYNNCSKIFEGKDYERYQKNSIFCEAIK